MHLSFIMTPVPGLAEGPVSLHAGVMKSLIPSTWDVPEIFIRRLGSEAGSQRVMIDGNQLLLILHEVPSPEGRGQAVLFWRDASGTWRTTAPGAGLPALKDLLDSYQRRIDELEVALARADTAGKLFPILRASTPIVRAAKHVHEVLQKAREAVKEDRGMIDLRDDASDIDREAELLHSEAKHKLDFEIAEQGEVQAQVGHELAVAGQRLNILAGIFLPMAAITSAFGMNMRHGLEHVQSPLLFWSVLGAGLLIGFVIRGRFRV